MPGPGICSRKRSHSATRSAKSSLRSGLNLLLGEADFFEGKDDEARARLEMVMSLYKGLQIRTQIAEAQGFLGELSLRHGDIAGASTQISESLHLRQEVGDEQGIAWTEILLARVEQTQQNPMRHVACWKMLSHGLSKRIAGCIQPWDWRSWGGSWQARVSRYGQHDFWEQPRLCARVIKSPVPPSERSEYERQIAAVRAELGAPCFRAAWAEGHRMTPQQAFSEQGFVLRSASVSPSPTPAEVILQRARAVGLTRRELDVLQPLAEGLTNAQIAERLVLSVVTVNSYLRSIYSKLGVSTRTAAMRFALDHGLLERGA